eukprot:gene9338-17041_t
MDDNSIKLSMKKLSDFRSARIWMKEAQLIRQNIRNHLMLDFNTGMKSETGLKYGFPSYRSERSAQKSSHIIVDVDYMTLRVQGTGIAIERIKGENCSSVGKCQTKSKSKSLQDDAKTQQHRKRDTRAKNTVITRLTYGEKGAVCNQSRKIHQLTECNAREGKTTVKESRRKRIDGWKRCTRNCASFIEEETKDSELNNEGISIKDVVGSDGELTSKEKILYGRSDGSKAKRLVKQQAVDFVDDGREDETATTQSLICQERCHNMQEKHNRNGCLKDARIVECAKDWQGLCTPRSKSLTSDVKKLCKRGSINNSSKNCISPVKILPIFVVTDHGGPVTKTNKEDEKKRIGDVDTRVDVAETTKLSRMQRLNAVDLILPEHRPFLQKESLF